jgi:hypothetical protein
MDPIVQTFVRHNVLGAIAVVSIAVNNRDAPFVSQHSPRSGHQPIECAVASTVVKAGMMKSARWRTRNLSICNSFLDRSHE